MTDQRLAPDAIAASTNLTGVVAAVQDDPDSPDATWLTATSAVAATDLRVTFPTPDGSPSGAQNFRYQLRKTTGTPNPTISSTLLQGGVLRKTFETGTAVSSTSGTVLEGDWADTDLVTVTDGSDVEFRVVSTPGVTLGALPALISMGTAYSSGVAAQSNRSMTMPTHVAGDLLFLLALIRNNDYDGVLTAVSGTADGGGNVWQLNNNGGSMFGGAQAARIGFAWRIATSASETCVLSSTGGNSTDAFLGAVFKFTAANGFATTAVSATGTPTTGTLSASQDITMPTVPSGGANELGVAIYATSFTCTVAAAGAVTGGTWAEPVAESVVTNGMIGMQVMDLSGGGGASGGTAASGSTTATWVAVPFRVIPASSGATNTVEIGAIEWNCAYGAAAAGQPTSKRFGAVPFVGVRPGIW